VLINWDKSEIAALCTLYGDMCGGWRPSVTFQDHGLPSLTCCTTSSREGSCRAHSREHLQFNAFRRKLRPDQKDTDSLPEYPVLDAILEDYIERFESVPEIAHKLTIPEDLVRDIVRKVDRTNTNASKPLPVCASPRKPLA